MVNDLLEIIQVDLIVIGYQKFQIPNIFIIEILIFSSIPKAPKPLTFHLTLVYGLINSKHIKRMTPR